MATLQSSGLEPEIRLKSLKNAKRRVMPGEEEIQNLDQFNPDVAGTANPSLTPAPIKNIPQPALGSQVSAQSYDPRANQVMTATPTPPQPIVANPNPLPSQESGIVEKKLGENLPAAAGVQQPIPQEMPAEQPPAQSQAQQPSKYGTRYGEDYLGGTGTQKGEGYFGSIPMQDGSGRIMSEVGMRMNFNGKEIEVPLLVPTLTHSEVDFLSKGDWSNIPPQIIQKARDHAEMRMAQGKSPFAQEGEQTPIGSQQGETPWGRLGRFLKESTGLRGEALQKQMEQQAQAIKEAKPYGPEQKPAERVGLKPPGIVPYEVNPITEAWENFIKSGKERQKQMIEQTQAANVSTPEVAAPTVQPPLSEQEQAIQQYQYHTDQVASQPELVQKFEEQTGKQFTPELQNEVRGAEQVMSDLTDGGNVVDTGDDEQAKRLKERILNNQATDADKYMIGLALVMPLIVGGMFGKEAGFGALAGGMKGLGEVYGRKAKDIQEAEELLEKINKNKAAKEAAATKGDLSSGMKDVEWVNRKTGKREVGKEIANGMAMKKEHLATKEQLKSAEAKATALQDKMTRSDEILKATKLISDVAGQIKDPAFWKQYRQYILSNYDPQLAAKFAPMVVIDGEEVNAATVMQQAIARVNSNYSKLFGLGQPDAAEQRLFGKILSDPTAGFISPAQVKYQADRMNTDSIDAILDDADRKGIQLDPEIFPYAAQKQKAESEKKTKSGARLASKEIGEL